MINPAPASSPLLGVFFICFGGLLLTINDGIMKSMTGALPVGELMSVRGLIAAAVVMAFILRSGWSRHMHFALPKLHVYRAGVMIGSTFMFVTGLSLLPLADAIALTFVGPIFLTTLAPYFLGERVGPWRWAAVLVGFVGMIIMLRPTGAGLHWAALLPLGAALAGAFRDILTRRIAMTDSSLGILMVTTAAVGLAGFITLPFGGWRLPSGTELGLLSLSSVLLVGAHYAWIEAFRYAEATLISPFKYIALIWAMLIGWLWWADVPDIATLMGAALIVVAGLFIFWRETRRTV